MNTRIKSMAGEAGFSLIELMIAMCITLVVMVLASTLIGHSVNIRSRENRRSEALADAQRALQTMTRDIGNAGMGLNVNGLVAGDSTSTSIRVRTNLNAVGTASDTDTGDDNEDVKYMLINDSNGKFIVRQNLQPTPASIAAATNIVANRVDSLTIRYFRQRVSYSSDQANCNITSVTPTNVTVGGTSVANEVASSPGTATYVVISVCVQLPAVGTYGETGYQPAMVVQLISDATLRNNNLTFY